MKKTCPNLFSHAVTTESAENGNRNKGKEKPRTIITPARTGFLLIRIELSSCTKSATLSAFIFSRSIRNTGFASSANAIAVRRTATRLTTMNDALFVTIPAYCFFV